MKNSFGSGKNRFKLDALAGVSGPREGMDEREMDRKGNLTHFTKDEIESSDKFFVIYDINRSSNINQKKNDF